MAGRKVLVLGAGVYQIPLIDRAQREGHHVIAASYRDTDPGLALADEAWVVDTTAKEELLKRSKEAGVEAVTTTGTDVAVPTLGFICDAMGLKGVPYDTALACSDKALMKEKFKAGAVPMAAGASFTDANSAKQFAQTMAAAYMIKAADSSGSRGVYAMNSLDGFEDKFAQAQDVSRSGDVLIEKRLFGEEFGAQLVVAHGQVQQAFFHNDTVTPPPISVPMGHSCPCRLSSDILKQAHQVCQQAVTALGIADAVCNVDLMACEEGVFIFEIGARGGATGLPEVVRDYSGVDLYKAALDLALGQPVSCEFTQKTPSAMLLLTSQKSGVLKSVEVPESLKADARTTLLRIDVQPGDDVPAFVTGPDRLGDVFVVAESLEQAEQCAAEFAQSVQFNLVPHDA